MISNLEHPYGCSIREQGAHDRLALIAAWLRKPLAFARRSWASLAAAGSIGRTPTVTVEPDLEWLPRHLQRDVGFIPGELNGRKLRIGRRDGFGSPQKVRERLTTAWPELQR
jgi:hypothetical protein